MLGPVPFIFYIFFPDLAIKSKLAIFADNSKLIGAMETKHDCEELQKNRFNTG